MTSAASGEQAPGDPGKAAVRSLAILGAGKLGIVLGQLATRAWYDVVIAGSGSPTKIALTVEVLVPGARVAAAADAVREADAVVLALPLGKYRTLDPAALAGKLVIDAMNYWWEVDGTDSEVAHPRPSSSEMVAAYLGRSRVVKGFNHIGYHDLYDEAAPAGTPGRKAVALAGADDDVALVAGLVDALGFDPLPIGPLANGIALEPGHPAFGADLTAPELDALVAADLDAC